MELVRCTSAIMFMVVTALAATLQSQDLPDYWKGLAGAQVTAPEATATSDILASGDAGFILSARGNNSADGLPGSEIGSA
jgi:hypothetical protein